MPVRELHSTPEAVGALAKRILFTAQSFAIAITIGTIGSVWAQPRVVAIIVTIFFLESTANWLLAVPLKHRLGHPHSGWSTPSRTA